MRPLEFRGRTIKSIGDTNLCHNLRPARSGGGLVPVGQPRRMTAGDFPGAELLPGGEYVHPDGHVTLFLSVKKCRLLCIEDGSAYYLKDYGDDPEAIVMVGDTLLVMVGEGKVPMELYRDGGRWDWRRQADIPEPLCIVRKDEGDISATIDARSLGGVYSSRSTSLTAADARELRDAVTDAYRSVGDRAMAKRVFFQPVVARYRLRGHDGRTLYESAPVIIAPDNGCQLTSATFTLTGGNFSQTSAATLTARTFSLSLSQAEPLSAWWRDAVMSVELLVSPQLHPLEESREPHYVFGRFTATSGSLTVMLPGFDGVSHPATVRSQVAGLLGRLDGVLEPAGSARYDPTKGANGEWTGLGRPFYSDRRDTMADVKALRSALSLPILSLSAEAIALRKLSAPHSFNASVTAGGGDLVAFASLSASRFRGWLPVEFMILDPHSGETQAVDSACRVMFADGSSRVRNLQVSGSGIGALSPLIVYPSADAVAVELYHGDRFMRFDLVPDPSGRMAFWLADEVKPVDLPAAAGNQPVPVESPLPVRFPGLVAVAPASLPLIPSAAVASTSGNPVAIVAAPGVSGGWDSGAGRFYLFGRGGIAALTINSARSRATVRHLDGRPVESRPAVCPVGNAVAAIAGGDLVSVAGQRVTTLRAFVGAGAIGWNSRHDEIICCYTPDFPCPENFTLLSGTEPEPLFPDAVALNSGGNSLVSRSLPRFSSWLSTPDGFWACTADGAVCNVLDESDEPVDSAFSARKEFGPRMSDRRAMRRLVEVPFRGEAEACTVEIHADNGGGPAMAMPVVSYEFAGRLPHLPPFQILAPHAHALNLTLRIRARPSALVLP